MEVVHKQRYTRGQKPGITSIRVLNGPKGNQKEEKSWIEPTRTPNPDEKKKMLALAIVAGVINVMDNHVYRFNRENRKQTDGGSIGNMLTGEVAKLVMAWWTNEFFKLARYATCNIMEEFIIDSGLYVDDMNVIFYPLPPGARWCHETGRIVVMEECKEDDKQHPTDRRSMLEMKKIANSICPIIQMEEDYPSKNQDNKLPILDLKVWVTDDNIIMHECYRKSMASRLIMMAESAMPKKMKRSVLTQEGIRILRNCSEDLP